MILDGFFTDPDRFTVTVNDGIVTLAGALGSVVLGRSIADQARHVEAVVAVRERFTYPLAGSEKAVGHRQAGPSALPGAVARRWHGSDGKDPQRGR